MFFIGFKLEPEKITTGTGRFFRRVQITTKKITTRKVKGTVVWPMEAAQIWRERYDQKKNVQSSGRLCFSAGSNYNRKIYDWKKKVQSSGRQLETGKNYVQKKGTVIWSSVGGQNTKHNTNHRHNNQQDVWQVSIT